MIKHILILLLLCQLGTSSAFANQMPLPHSIQYKDVLLSDDKLFINDQIDISNLYPNPANDVVKFNYVLSDVNAKVKITIRNVLGSIVSEDELSAEARHLEINVHEYSAGMYFYTLSINNKSIITKKFLVKR